MNPRWPVYIVSKNRWHFQRRQTARALERMGVPYFIVVEESQADNYRAVCNGEVLILPQKYVDDYDTFDDFGGSKSKGPGAARNFAWDHSIANGAKWHWVMDDNIRVFFRLHKNMKIPVADGTIFLCIEDFCLRCDNVGVAGPNYWFFIPRKAKCPPFITNTRIYSCNLIRNDLPFRWRGRYNEDTDLSLRILKDGWATVQFYAFLQGKAPTQTVQGGNTADFYNPEGTLPKSEMLVRMHHDVARLQWRFGRPHHVVDYSRFTHNPLRKGPKPDFPAVDYGFKLKHLTEDEMKDFYDWKRPPEPPPPPGDGECDPFATGAAEMKKQAANRTAEKKRMECPPPKPVPVGPPQPSSGICGPLEWYPPIPKD